MHRRQKTGWLGIAFTMLAVATLTGIFTACQPSRPNTGETAATVFTQDDIPLQRQRIATAFRLDVRSQMELAINESIASGAIPGGVLWIEHDAVHFESSHG